MGTARLLQTSLLLTARPRLSGLYPPLIYFGQVYGALVKTYYNHTSGATGSASNG